MKSTKETVASLELISNKAFITIGIASGILNSVFWTLFSLSLVPFEFRNLIWWWMLLLNIIVSFGVAQQRSHNFQRLFWIIGITLFVTIFCSLTLGFWDSYQATGWNEVTLLYEGRMRGGLIGFVIGVVAGISTSPSRFSTVNIIQKIVGGIITSINVGIGISVISVIIFAISMWITQLTDNLNYPPTNLGELILVNVLMIAPLGAIPSITTGLTTTIANHYINWWLIRKKTTQDDNVG